MLIQTLKKHKLQQPILQVTLYNYINSKKYNFLKNVYKFTLIYALVFPFNPNYVATTNPVPKRGPADPFYYYEI